MTFYSYKLANVHVQVKMSHGAVIKQFREVLFIMASIIISSGGSGGIHLGFLVSSPWLFLTATFHTVHPHH